MLVIGVGAGAGAGEGGIGRVAGAAGIGFGVGMDIGAGVGMLRFGVVRGAAARGATKMSNIDKKRFIAFSFKKLVLINSHYFKIFHLKFQLQSLNI